MRDTCFNPASSRNGRQVNLPLIVAGVVILSLHWQDTEPCDNDHRQKWRWWALISVVRMVLITPVVLVSLVLHELSGMLSAFSRWPSLRSTCPCSLFALCYHLKPKPTPPSWLHGTIRCCGAPSNAGLNCVKAIWVDLALCPPPCS